MNLNTLKKIGLAFCIVVTVGCREDANSLSREWRNINNEYIDSLMVTVDDSSAKNALLKFVNDYDKKVKIVEYRLGIWIQNMEKEVVVESVLGSDSFAVYLAECKTNLDRLDLELERLKKVAEDAQRNAVGGKTFPNLLEIAQKGKHSTFRDALKSGGKLVSDLSQKFRGEFKVPETRIKDFVANSKKRYGDTHIQF